MSNWASCSLTSKGLELVRRNSGDLWMGQSNSDDQELHLTEGPDGFKEWNAPKLQSIRAGTIVISRDASSSEIGSASKKLPAVTPSASFPVLRSKQGLFGQSPVNSRQPFSEYPELISSKYALISSGVFGSMVVVSSLPDIRPELVHGCNNVDPAIRCKHKYMTLCRMLAFRRKSWASCSLT